MSKIDPVTARHLPMADRVALVLASNATADPDDDVIADAATIADELAKRDLRHAKDATHLPMIERIALYRAALAALGYPVYLKGHDRALLADEMTDEMIAAEMTTQPNYQEALRQIDAWKVARWEASPEAQAWKAPLLQAYTISGKAWGVPEGTLCIRYTPHAGAGGPSFCRMLIV